jgi:hypothetical protein
MDEADKPRTVQRPVEPCPFYRVPCEYVPMAHQAEGQEAEIARLTAALEKIPIAIREAGLTSPYSTGTVPAFQYGLSDGYEAAAQVADECVRAALQQETDR